MIEAIGWGSSLILVVTISRQVLKQWKDRAAEGVSKWLFVGQIAASTGFVVYSALLRNWVFVVTNALMLVAALIGLATVVMARGRQSSRTRTAPVSAQSSSSTASSSVARASGPAIVRSPPFSAKT